MKKTISENWKTKLDQNWMQLFHSLKNENQRLRIAVDRALAIGDGGVELVHEKTGIPINTIQRGIIKLMDSSSKVFSVSSGRSKIEEEHPEILEQLVEIIHTKLKNAPLALWNMSSRSLSEELSQELGKRGYTVSYKTILRLIKDNEETINKDLFIENIEHLKKMSSQKSWKEYYGGDVDNFFNDLKVAPKKDINQ